jgi:hypothetical protein
MVYTGVESSKGHLSCYRVTIQPKDTSVKPILKNNENLRLYPGLKGGLKLIVETLFLPFSLTVKLLKFQDKIVKCTRFLRRIRKN